MPIAPARAGSMSCRVDLALRSTLGGPSESESFGLFGLSPLGHGNDEELLLSGLVSFFAFLSPGAGLGCDSADSCRLSGSGRFKLQVWSSQRLSKLARSCHLRDGCVMDG